MFDPNSTKHRNSNDDSNLLIAKPTEHICTSQPPPNVARQRHSVAVDVQLQHHLPLGQARDPPPEIVPGEAQTAVAVRVAAASDSANIGVTATTETTVGEQSVVVGVTVGTAPGNQLFADLLGLVTLVAMFLGFFQLGKMLFCGLNKE